MKLKPLLALLLAIAPVSLHAYDIEQFVRDTQKNPDRIYKNLHPDAKAYVDRGIALYQSNEAFRKEKYVEFDKDPAKMKPAKIWSFIWEDNGFTEFYSEGYTVLNSFENGEWRYVTVKENGWGPEVIMLDTYVFRKSGDDYLFYPPGWLMDYYTPIDYLEPSDDPVKNAMLERLIKTRIEESMTEEDKESFKNAKSAHEVAEIINNVIQQPSQEHSNSDKQNSSTKQ